MITSCAFKKMHFVIFYLNTCIHPNIVIYLCQQKSGCYSNVHSAQKAKALCHSFKKIELSCCRKQAVPLLLIKNNNSL